VFSGFNQPDDISMVEDFEALCGITKEELLTVFAKPIRELAQKWKITEEEVKTKLKRQYDGYHFSENMLGVYNPFSLLNCFRHKKMADFWFSSGTPTYLVRLLNHTQEQLNEMVGQYYFPEEFIDYKATVEQPLPMIYQSGYLTIKDYDPEMNSFLLDFPNNEVKKGFLTLVAADYLKPKERVTSWIQQAVEALRQGKIEQFRDQLTAFLASVPYSMRRKQDEREYERYFHYTFYLLLRLLSVYTVYSEKEQSQGRVDCIVETPDYIYIFEFKLDGSAEQALQQIKDKGYEKPYLTDPRKLYQIGVNFSSETGTIEGFKYENAPFLA
ncbi:MAG: ATP-binding protein, partial [Alistipes sp.]|nr:ATP-binding protein [Alistipes sp.]